MDDARMTKHIEFLRIREILIECIKVNNIRLDDFNSIAYGLLVRQLKSNGIPKEEIHRFLVEMADDVLKVWDQF